MEPKKMSVTVDQELTNYIERLGYEEASYRDIITTMLEMHKGDSDASAIDNPVFKAYQKQFDAVKTEFTMAKERITKEYVPDCLKEHQTDWNLDYETNVLTITVYCDCGIKAMEEYLCHKN